MPRHARRTAFTLVELLVVVAIIAILAAILVPAIGAVRRSAAQATCAGNLRQIGMGILAYAEDHHRLPPQIHDQNWSFGNLSATGNHGGAPVAAAAVLLGGYLDTSRVFYCPCAAEITPAWWNIDPASAIWTATATWSSSSNPGLSIPGDWVYSYTSYCWWAGYSYAYGPTPAGIATSLNSPADAVLASDMCFPAGSLPFTGSHAYGRGGSSGGNVLVRDGSVAWVPFAQMKPRQHYYMDFCF